MNSGGTGEAGGRFVAAATWWVLLPAVAVGLLLLLISGGPKAGASSFAAGDYRLVSANSGKCAEIYGFSQDNFGGANQWTCWGGPNQRIQATPLRRLGEPRDIGGIAVFLASEAAAFITGQCIVADGGVTIL